MEKTYTVKIVLLGEGAVGKTSLRKRYLKQGFSQSHLMTLGADYGEKTIDLLDDNPITMQIWDVAGQPSFKQIRARFIQNVEGAAIVFDLTRYDTFKKLGNWLKELWKANPGRDIPILLIGNKVDLTKERKIDTNTILKFIDYLASHKVIKISFINYLETSAKTGENVEKGFNMLIKGIYRVNILKSPAPFIKI